MKTLMKHGMAVLILTLASTLCSAVDLTTPIQTELADQGRIALIDIERSIQADLHLASRIQLHEALPAELAAMPVHSAAAIAAVTTSAGTDSARSRVLVISRRSNSENGERPSMRWQSLLPGMMK